MKSILGSLWGSVWAPYWPAYQVTSGHQCLSQLRSFEQAYSRIACVPIDSIYDYANRLETLQWTPMKLDPNNTPYTTHTQKEKKEPQPNPRNKQKQQKSVSTEATHWCWEVYANWFIWEIWTEIWSRTMAEDGASPQSTYKLAWTSYSQSLQGRRRSFLAKQVRWGDEIVANNMLMYPHHLISDVDVQR